MTRIIDPHVHIWTNDPRFPWAPETENPPTTNHTPEALLALMAINGVEKTVLVQYIGYRWDNSYVVQALKTYPDKFMGVARVNPQDPSAPDHLSDWVETHGLHGVRLSPASTSEGDWFTSPLMPPLFRRASDLGVPMLILTEPSRLPDLVRLLDKHPDLDVVVDHMANANPANSQDVQRLLELARYPRLYVKTGHIWSTSKQAYPWLDTHGLVEQVYQTFGPQRMMWGTDWPVCLNKTTYAQTLSVIRDEMSFITPEDKEWILGKTVLKLWKFE